MSAEDDIAIIYKADALGKQVWIKFPVDDEDDGEFKFFQGTITRMQAAYEGDDVNKPIEYTHFVKFGDTDDAFYDLSDLEMTGYLRWEEPSEEDAAPAAMEGIKAPESSITTTAQVVNNTRVVTPTKTTNKRKSRPTSTKRAKVKTEPGTSASNYEKGNDEINLQEFEHWLRNVHRGSKGDPLSESNVRTTMNRVRDLISGRGVSYKNWPSSVRFCPTTKVDLTFDITELHQKAKNFEAIHGRDKGNGWLLQHPIKKLLLYKEHVEEWGKRY